MAITEDPSTPLIINKTGSGNPVTAAFSPPSGTLLVALVAGGWGSANPTVVVTDSGGHTWTVAATSSGTSSIGGIAKIAYTYLTSAPGSITVTASFTGLSGGSMLAVRVLNGAKSSQTGAGSGVAQSAAGSTVGTVSITTTAAGSQVYGINSSGTNSSITFAPNAATSVLPGTSPNLGDYGDTSDSVRLVAWKATAVTGTPGATVLGGTWSSSTVNNEAAFEVLAAATATLQGAAALSGTTTLTAAAGATTQATAALSGVASLTGPAAVTEQTTCALSAASSLTSDGARVTPAAAALTGVSTAVVGPFIGQSASVALPASSALAIDGRTVKVSAAALTSTSSLTAAALLGPSAQLLGAATLTAAVGVQTEAAAAALAGNSALIPVAGLVAQASALCPATSSLAAQITVPAGAQLLAASTLGLTPQLTAQAATALSALAGLTGTAQLTERAAASLTGMSGLTVASPLLITGGTGAVLVSSSNLTAVATSFVPAFVWPTGTPVNRVKTPVYRLYAANTRTGRIGWELPVANASWNTPINAAGTLRATLAIEATLDHLYTQGANDPRTALREVLTGPYLNSLVLTYGDAAVFAGPYLPASIPADKPTIDVGATELLAIFDKRILYDPTGTTLVDPTSDLSLGPASQGELIRSIIAASTTGTGRELPITCSNPPNPVGNAQVTYFGFNLTTAGSALGQIASQGIGAPGQLTITPGPDYRLDPYLVTGSDGLYVAWELRIGNPYLNAGIQPWSFDDATSMVSQEIDASKMASTYYVPGSGQDRMKLIATATDSSLINAGFPMLEEVDSSYTSEINGVLLNSYAAADVVRYVSPVDKWIIQTRVEQLPRLGSYRVGDPMVIDIQRHPVINPGIYPRRITDISGDVSALVSISSAEMLAK